MKGHPMMMVEEPTTTTQSPTTEQPTLSYENQVYWNDQQQPNKFTDTYADDMELSYDNNYVPQSSNVNLQYLDRNSEPHYLTGPMVFRVHPDGSPVMEDRLKPLPKDDDRDDMTMGRTKLPTMEEIRLRYRQIPLFTRPQSAYRLLPPYSNL